MTFKKKFYITSAIAYASGKPHIGNVYEIILTDSIARFKRYLGYDVFFLTGTDEHGQKIQEVALSKNITPKQNVDEISSEIKKIFDMVDIKYDRFIRTTDVQHVKSVQKIFEKLYNQGDIYKGMYVGWYCVSCESFWTQTQVVNVNRCPDCGRNVEQQEEEAYFFNMKKYQDKLLNFFEENVDFIQPLSRKKEIMNNFLEVGLQDLCVSRTSFNWGIPVSFDPKHVVYVWIDALSNYITALGYSPGEKNVEYEKYWPADVHIIGKDILRFHSVYWPIMLMALDEPLPKKIFAHPWLLVNSDKMSKTVGNVIYTDFLVKHFGTDAVRYIVMSEMPYLADGSISFETVISKYNSDLANSLGNLVSRVVAMTNKYFSGIVNNVKEIYCSNLVDDDLKSACSNCLKNVINFVNDYKISSSLKEIWKFINRINKYIDETTPWNLANDKNSMNRLREIIYNLLESIRFVAFFISSFMPRTSEKISKILGVEITFESIEKFGNVEVFNLTGGEVLFKRIDAKEKLREIYLEIENDNKVVGNIKKNVENKINCEDKVTYKQSVDIRDFEKLDIRVGKILECEKVPRSSKLLKFIIECGDKKRQILSGILKYYSPKELIGKNILFIANLKSVEIMGFESNGMILSASIGNKVSLTTVLDDIQSGAIIT
ncbi:MAG: methionine--tRNA ligase [Clostridiales bacterium]|jgi:methionyl-tRNA synthetase|nr:methionine--tRNA ligase [Clostridiales bacterium]